MGASARSASDAGGLVVAPGFIDVHTHYGAQYTWDPYATSSIWHGVTTTVIGNCGFAIAPCRPADRDLIMRTLVKVEGMSPRAVQPEPQRGRAARALDDPPVGDGRRLTDDPARAYRIPQRGRLEPGYWADVAIFDPSTMDALPAERVTDLPADEPRFVARARGVEWSLVNGQPVLERGRVVEQPVGKRPGQVLRRFDA